MMRNLWQCLMLAALLLVPGLLLAACGVLGGPAGAEPAANDTTAAEVATDIPTPTLAVPPAGGEVATALPPTPTGFPLPALPDMGLAPDFSNEIWLNSEPLRLADLRGKVVLVEFWTFGCINCQRMIPYMREWHDAFTGEDFIIVSVHYPEFSYEENVDNVRDALLRNGIAYPVAIDNDGRTWRAYQQRYWPTRYVLDKEGHIRYKHIGEGAYDETAAVISYLMREPEPGT